MESLEEWLARQHSYAAHHLLACISRTDLVKERPGFGHRIRAQAGSVVASPVLADWDPEPDYFFHWYRDSALVIDALRLLYVQQLIGGEALVHLADFVTFSRALGDLDGRELVDEPRWRANVREDFERYVRPEAELADLRGDAVVADTRVNPDGTLDISRWTRPQHDAAPLRALALLRWLRVTAPREDVAGALAALVRADLDFTCRRWHAPAFDMWEEELGLHYHTLSVAAVALEAGGEWLAASAEDASDAAAVPAWRSEAQRIRARLDAFWDPRAGYLRSRILHSQERSTKELDIAVILAAIHTAEERTAGEHSARDPRMHATLERLEALFDAEYAINRGRHAGTAPAMGRYAGDRYFSGGAYYFSTLGAAELCYRAAAGAADADEWARRGDAFLATVRAFTPAGGEMSEQFDQHTGAQTSARHLGWSYAAFISCMAARRAARGETAA